MCDESHQSVEKAHESGFEARKMKRLKAEREDIDETVAVGHVPCRSQKEGRGLEDLEIVEAAK